MDTGELLYEPIFEKALSYKAFVKEWEDDVSDMETETCLYQLALSFPFEGCTAYVLASGLVVVEDERKLWSAYKSKSYVETKDLYAAWARFSRGTWVDRVPTEPGVYPTRDREGARGRDRMLVKVNGKLVDCTCCSELVLYGKVSNWAGSWWSHSYPTLPNAI